MNPPHIPDNIRRSYIDTIVSIPTHNKREVDEITKAIQWLRTSPALNKPYNTEQHLGVLSIILSQTNEETFLIHHKKAKLWLPPGGHVDLGQTLNDTASRELEEELGITNPIMILNHPVYLTHTLTQGTNAGHIDLTSWYVFEGDNSITYKVQEKEASNGTWTPIKEILANPQYGTIKDGFIKIKNLLDK